MSADESRRASPAGVREAKPQPSRLAISSLAMGILVWPSCGWTVLPGLILGLAALMKIGNGRRGWTGRGMAIGGITISTFGAILLILWLGPAYPDVRLRAKLAQSRTNGLQLITTLMLYAQDHDGFFPPDWDTAFDDTGVDGSEIRISPLSESPSEFLYLTPNVQSYNLPPDTPVIRDPNELIGKTVVGYANGMVRVERAGKPGRLEWLRCGKR